ncbi:hypothetical protein AgCh_022114 [Apium graveolens]
MVFLYARDRKYPNGVRPNRTAASGFWKATGTDKPILSAAGSRRIGVKKALVFYTGRPPKGVKTDWIMTEYRLPDTIARPYRAIGSMRLDDWVLCRIRQKGNKSKNSWAVEDDQYSFSPPPRSVHDITYMPKIEELHSVYPESNTQHNYLLQDCQTSMSSLQLSDQDSPPLQTMFSNANLSEFIITPLFEDSTKSELDNRYNVSPDGSKKMVTDETSSNNHGFGDLVGANMINCYNQNQSQAAARNLFSNPPSAAIMSLILSHEGY